MVDRVSEQERKREINNPLGVMVTRIKMLLADGRQEGYPPELMNNLEVIEAHSGRIAEIVRNLLGFARTAVPRKQRIEVNTLITKTLAMVEIPFAKSQITTHPVRSSSPISRRFRGIRISSSRCW